MKILSYHRCTILTIISFSRMRAVKFNLDGDQLLVLSPSCHKMEYFICIYIFS